MRFDWMASSFFQPVCGRCRGIGPGMGRALKYTMAEPKLNLFYVKCANRNLWLNSFFVRLVSNVNWIAFRNCSNRKLGNCTLQSLCGLNNCKIGRKHTEKNLRFCLQNWWTKKGREKMASIFRFCVLFKLRLNNHWRRFWSKYQM